MKTCLRSLFTALVLAAAMPSFVHASERPHTPMEDSMEKIDDAFKALSRALKAPDDEAKTSYLEWIATIKTEAVKSSGLVPAKIAEMPAAAQAPVLAAYKKEMAAFIEMIDTLDKAVSAGNWEEANAVIKTMRKAKSAGHEAYKKE